MTTLKPAQVDILKDAAARDGLAADTVDGRTAAALIKRGYLISLPRDGQASLLTITREGREAVGLPEERRAARRKKPPAGAAPEPEPTLAAGSKTAALRSLLERPEGATIAQMTEASGWQPHSIRGFVAGTLKKKFQLAVVAEKTDAGRIYRIVPAAA